MKPKIVLLATGGTIASRYDAKLGRTVASQRADELLRMLPQVADFAEIEVHDIATIPSYQMDLQFAFGLARRINEVLDRPEVAGVVVTHGTDTMEETCYLADLLLRFRQAGGFHRRAARPRRSAVRRPTQSAERLAGRGVAVGPRAWRDDLLQRDDPRRARCDQGPRQRGGDIPIVRTRCSG